MRKFILIAILSLFILAGCASQATPHPPLPRDRTAAHG